VAALLVAVPRLGGAEVVAPFGPGEQIDLSVDYLHVHTAQARVLVGRAEGSIWPIIVQARTDGLVGLLDIREHLVSYWDADAGVSRGTDLNAIEIGDRHTDRARFDRENGKVAVRVLRRGLTQERTLDVPRDVHDLASALLHLRRQALAPGEHVECKVFTGEETFTLSADVVGRERVETPAGRFDAVRVRVRYGLQGRFAASDAEAWFSDDARHVPLRMTAGFAVGRVTATLVGYRPGAQVAAR
jgi:hypothetical protein